MATTLPHRLSGSGSPYPSISRNSRNSLALSESSDLLRTPPSDPHASGSRGTYAPVNESDATEMRERGDEVYQQFLFWGAIILGGLLVIAGVVIAVVLTRHKSSHNNAIGGTNSSDPSKFTTDPNLHNSFYGIAYTPTGAILPSCGATREAVINDIQILSQMTTRIRTYGADCNVTYLILDAIKETKVNVSVYLGIYIDTSDDSVYQRQKNATQSALQTFGGDKVLGLTVGNEVILNACTQAGQTNPNDTAGIQAAELLKTKVTDIKSMLSGISLSKIPVGTADAGSYFNTDILGAVDYAMANIHPWFASIGPLQGATWTWQFLQDNDISLAKGVSNTPEFYIAETGWPTNSSTVAGQTNGAGVQASVGNLQIFIDNFVCQANQNNTGYFFFEFMDEPWKLVQYPGVEGYWGLFDSNKKLKNITIPNCSHS
ncbi:glycoside hydrolase superfamily [Cantharellus anzutake]|uniref:glycoside hydrolase superfamily n=1 Tax=Cantharellus anzutake TaxID=1750568 RepID=UPI0019081187|nr:glycoside hydrolase superfamily [Cantharellus anzutake]KAF8340607.1 glycoside hydrolase superfamily [Cantharellus anzutake]